MYLFFSGQQSLMKDKADTGWKKGLWIYFRTAQIGDSLMDLAARDFFISRGCRIDLLTHEKLKDLYEFEFEKEPILPINPFDLSK